MADSKIKDLYDQLDTNFLSPARSDEFYNYFINMVQSGRVDVSLYEKFVERRIDMRWVEAIEEAIIPLDEVIRNPIRYLKNEEEIIPIAQARKIGIESVKHLAQHTNMIASVEGDKVTPQSILNVRKEESFDIYENRFVYTLLQKLQYFLDKRLEALAANLNATDSFNVKFNGETTVGHDKLKFTVDISLETPHVDVGDNDKLINVDVSKLTNMQRVERIRKILYNFQGSALIKSLYGCATVRPPLNMTNVMKKNQNFRKIVDLWLFVERYNEMGYSVSFIERDGVMDKSYYDEMCSILGMQYVVMKRHTSNTEDVGDYEERRQPVEPHSIKKSINEIIDSYDLSIDEIKRVFIDQIAKRKKKLRLEFLKVRGVITRAIKGEKEKLDEEYRARKLAEARLKLKEKELQEREKEKARQEKLREKARKEKEKEALLKQKEREKAKKEKEKEALLKLKEKAKKQKEKELAKKEAEKKETVKKSAPKKEATKKEATKKEAVKKETATKTVKKAPVKKAPVKKAEEKKEENK